MSVEKKIVIKADIEASLKGMDAVVSELETGLKKQKYDFSKNTGLAKLIKQYQAAKQEFDTLAGSGEVEVGLSTKAIKAGEKTISLYKRIGQAVKQLPTNDANILKSIFPDNFSAKVDKGVAEIDRFFKKLAQKEVKESQLTLFEKDLSRLEGELDELRNRRIKIEVVAETEVAQKKLQELKEEREQLIGQVRTKLTAEAKDSDGKTRTERLREARDTAAREYTAAEQRERNAQKSGRRDLTEAERAAIQRKKQEYEGAEFKGEEAVAKKTLQSYITERATRESRRQTGGGDPGRQRRRLGHLTDEEIEEEIAAAQSEIDELNRRRARLQQEIREIENRPKSEQSRERNEAASAKAAAKVKLDAAKAELQVHEELRNQQVAAAEAATQEFASGKQPAGVSKEDVELLREYTQEIEEQTEAVRKLQSEKTFASQEEKDTRISSKESDIEAKRIQIQKIKNDIAEIGKATSIEEVFKKLEKLNIPLEEGLAPTKENLEKIKKELGQLDSKTVQRIKDALLQMGMSADEADDEVRELAKGLDQIEDEAAGIKRAEQEMDQLKNQVLQFFSITNSIQLFKRTIQSAINTIKELDAVMTETAVVTSFSVGDMWEKLPEYAKGASELGASITDLYQATTLYYQQGLQTNAAMAVGTETVKMARIASMDASQATQAMTAALRGFNMEINEMDAQRVNDVYSELAAITAADTSQIATAMTKTASIAAGANMEFETTAALLAQIIETTQEAPETAGTAMKTIVARFSEVKNLKDKGEVAGSDEEGEEINVNNIDKALRSVGISMEGFFNGTEGLDSVLLKLAEKWNTLDFETQRYIATTAAGSRQQSRFIAMMSDYERTLELVDAANGSAGASQEQYEKTLESLEAKLNKLQNAWKTFTMGLANDEAVKKGVDILTGILDGINWIIDAISGNSGLQKSLLSLITTLGALKIGGSVFGALFDTAKKAALGSGSITGSAFVSSLKTSMGERFKGFGEFFKALFPSKKKMKALVEQPISEAIKGIDFSKMSQVRKRDIGKSLLADFEQSMPNKSKMGTDANPDFMVKKSEYKQEIEKLFEEGKMEEGIQKMDQYAKGCDKTFKMSEKSAKKMTTTVSSGLAKATVAAAGLAAMFTGISKILDEMGHKKASNVFQILATGATALAGILAVLPGLFQAIGVSISSIPIIGWIAAAITALISLLAIVQEFVETSSEKTERIRKETEAAKQAAENAAQAYQTLLGDQEQYKETQKALDELIKGTDEWKMALVEANNKVLALLGTYPELANWISIGEYGQLTFDEAGWKKIMENQQKAMQASQTLATGKRIEQINDERDNKIGTIATKYEANKEELRGLYDAYLENSQIFEMAATQSTRSAEFEKLLSDNGISALTNQEILDLADAVAEYDTYFRQTSAEISGLRDTGLRIGASEEFLSYKYGEQILDVFSAAQGRNAYGIAENSLSSRLSNGNFEDLERLSQQEGVAISGKDKEKVEDLQKIYAAMAGIDVSEIPEEMADDAGALADAIAKMDMAEKHKEAMEDFRKNMEKLSEEDQKLMSSLLSGSTAGLSVKELNTYKDASIEDYATKMGYDSLRDMAEELQYSDVTAYQASREMQASYAEDQLSDDEKQKYLDKDDNFDFNKFLEANSEWADRTTISAEYQLEFNLEKTKEAMQQTYDEAVGVIEAKAPNSIEKIENATIEVVTNLSKQIAQMGAEDAQAYLNAWAEITSKGLSGKDSQALQSYLSTLDLSNLTGLVEAVEYMRELGTAEEDIKAFWDSAVNGVSTYAKTLSEVLALMKRFQTSGTDVQEIKDRLLQGKGTEQDVEKLIKAGVDINDLQLTPEGWRASEEVIEDAIKKLYEYNATTAALTTEQQKAALKDAESWYNNLQPWFNKTGLITEDEEGKKVAGTIKTLDDADYFASMLGLTRLEGEEEGAFIQRIQQELLNFVNLLNNGEMWATGLKKSEAMTEAAAYTSAENQGRFYAQGNDPHQAAEGPIQLSEQQEQSVIYSAQNEATAAGLDVGQMTEYAQAIMETNSGLSEMEATQIALNNSRMNSGLGEIIDSYDSWTGLIDENTGLIKATASEDVAAYNKLKASVNKMLNTSEDLSDSFWNNAENMKNLKKAAEGDTEALEALQKAAASDYLTNMDFGLQTDEDIAKGAVEDFVDYMKSVDIPKLEAGVEWQGDDAQAFIDNFNDMAQASNMSAEQIQEAVQSMGFNAKIKMVKETRSVPVYRTESWQETDGDKTITHSGSPVIEGYEDVEGYFPVVETLTASGAGGGGVSTENVDGGNANAKKGKKSGSKSEKYKNPYDKQYNSLEEINEALRERERLERRYQRLLDQSNTKGSDLVKNAEEQIAKAEEEVALRETLRKGRVEQIQEEIDKSGLSNYYSVAQNEFGEYEIRIDWEAINSVKDQEEGKKIEESLGDVEKWRDSINEENDAIEDIYDEVKEIREQGEDEYFDLETRIKDALVQIQQNEIDKLSEINASINDTSARLLETMQYNLEQERQMRENDKTEQELEDKQRRLEYLSQDTSGANALEIEQLQKEIDEGRESYTDTLIDQKISELQHQNDEAAEQRQRQIDIAQSQLDHYIDTGEIWSNVYSLMENGIGTDGIIPGSELEKLLKDNEDWAGKSIMEQLKWGNELKDTAAQAIQYLKVGNSTESLIASKELKAGQSVKFTTSDGKTLSGKLGENGDIVAEGKTYKKVYRNFDGTYTTDEAYQGKSVEPPKPETPPQVEEEKEIKVGGKINAKGAKIYDYPGAPAENQAFHNDPIYKVLAEKDGYVQTRHHTLSKGVTGWFKKSAVKAYKTGGLADYTGPAWLDGTKSKPELVLNAQDTQNFIQLKNVLASLMSGTGKSSENIGDSTYDIDINVESIGSDYDVEQMAEKIKNLINQDARYRNNNTVSLTR